MRRSIIGLVAGVLVAGAGCLVWILGAPASSAPGHTLLHIGCRHHNHGPKWHADHGRILGTAGSGSSSIRAGTEPDDLADRSLTAGRGRKSEAKGEPN